MHSSPSSTKANRSSVDKGRPYETGRWLNIFLSAFVVALLVWGWLNKDQGYLSPERGLGYWLGIVGCSFMLLLLLYSLRKRLRVLRNLLAIRFWFRFHMALGVIGPLCILFHSNFHLGSFNSTVALVCMLLVAGSGLIGRYFYTRIHYSLYGEKIRLHTVKQDFQNLKKQLAPLFITNQQKQYGEELLYGISKLLEGYSHNSGTLVTFASRRRAHKIAVAFTSFVDQLETYHQLKSGDIAEFSALKKSLDDSCNTLLTALKKLPGLQLFERLFSLWHVVHIPIFILMILTAITHVVVVHMY